MSGDHSAGRGPVAAAATVGEVLRAQAERQPDALAYRFLTGIDGSSTPWTYRELDVRARKVAARLRADNLRNKPVLVLHPPGLEYVASFLGCLLAGAIAVPAYPPDTARFGQTVPRLAAIGRDCRASHALTTDEVRDFADRSRAELREVGLGDLVCLGPSDIDTAEPLRESQTGSRPESLAFLQYTSGSTSTPKGVMVSNSNLIANLGAIHERLGHDGDSQLALWLPPYHDMGLIGGILNALYGGIPLHFMAPMTFVQRPLLWLETIAAAGSATAIAPNFGYEQCLRRVSPAQRDALDLSGWRLALNGAEPVRADTMERFADFFAPSGFRRRALSPCYGLAEATLLVTGVRPERTTKVGSFASDALEERVARPAGPDAPRATRIVSCGPVAEGVEVAIVDTDSGRTLPDGRIGEIWTAGPSVARGYWRRPDATRETFQARIDPRSGTRYLRTGDLGFLREGELYVTGRTKDVVIVQGRNYFPHDVESTVEKADDRFRPNAGAAFGVPLDGAEQLVVAYEIDSRSAVEDPASMLAKLRAAIRLEHEVAPHAVLLLRRGAVHRTTSGKVQRAACRRDFMALDLPVLAASVVRDEPEGGEGADPAPGAASAAVGAFASARTAGRPLMLSGGPARPQDVARAVAEALAGDADLDPETRLAALAVDYQGLLTAVRALERRFGARVPIGEVLARPRVGTLVSLLGGEGPGPGDRAAAPAPSPAPAAVPAAAPEQPYREAADGLVHWLCGRIAERLGLPAAHIDPGAPFAELGLDSRQLVAVCEQFSAHVGHEVSPRLAYDHVTIRALATAVASGAARRPEPARAPAPAALPAAAPSALGSRPVPSTALVGAPAGVPVPGPGREPAAARAAAPSASPAVAAAPVAAGPGPAVAPGERGTATRAGVAGAVAPGAGSLRTASAGAGGQESGVCAVHDRAPDESGVAAGGHAPGTGEPIAIVGMGCRFPGAPDVEGFRRLLLDGRSAVTEVPPERWDAGAVGAPGFGGFLDRVEEFDARFFGISAREAARMDPQQRLLLETAWQALDDAGIAPQSLAGADTGVFVGISSHDYYELQMRDLDSVDVHAATGNAQSVAANRLSYTLDLTGPSIAVDTACSSSLVAVHTAIRSLRSGECRTALAAGVNLMLTPALTVAFGNGGMLSPDGTCRTFDDTADGYVRGEGAGVLVLKPLSAALADGDRVHAVLKGSALGHGGRANGLTAPRTSAQRAVIERALREAGLAGDAVDYVEAHGTGTALGDPIEWEALAGVYGRDPATGRTCLVGSAKTNIGHLEAAAGVAGLIKAALVVRDREVPPSLHFETPNRRLSWAGSGLEVPTARRALPAGAPVRAAVSSFGFGGTNAHAVLESPPAAPAAPAKPAPVRPVHALCLSGHTETALTALARNYRGHLAAHPDVPLADVCHTANTGRNHFPHRAVVTAHDHAELDGHLAALVDGTPAAGVARGRAGRGAPEPRTAFLFSGQGSQYTGMGRELADTHPVVAGSLRRSDEVLRPLLGVPLADLLFAPESGERLRRTRYCQPALVALEIALAELWMSAGVRPAAVLGHSVGAYAAAHVAGALSLEDALRLTAARAAAMDDCPGEGAMAACVGDPQAVHDVLAAHPALALAAANTPEHLVLSGPAAEIDLAARELAARSVTVRLLKVSHAFHSAQMAAAAPALREAAARCTPAEAAVPWISDMTGQPVRGTVEPGYWADHLLGTVRFADGLRALRALGCDGFVEVGPHPVLLGFARATAPAERAATELRLPTAHRQAGDWETFLRSLGRLHCAGGAVDWAALDRPYRPARTEVPHTVLERQPYWWDGAAAEAPGPRPEPAEDQEHPERREDGEHRARPARPGDANSRAPRANPRPGARPAPEHHANEQGLGSAVTTQADPHVPGHPQTPGDPYAAGASHAAADPYAPAGTAYGPPAYEHASPYGSAAPHEHAAAPYEAHETYQGRDSGETREPYEPYDAYEPHDGYEAHDGYGNAGFEQAPGHGQQPEPSQTATADVLGWVQQVSGFPADQIPLDARLGMDLGLDSLMKTDLERRIAAKYPHRLAQLRRSLPEDPTVMDVVRTLGPGRAGGPRTPQPAAAPRPAPGRHRPAPAPRPAPAARPAPAPAPVAAADTWGADAPAPGTAPGAPVTREVHIEQWAEYAEIQGRMRQIEASGANAYGRVHDGFNSGRISMDGRPVVNFSAFNYLALSHHPRLIAAAKDAVDRYGTSCSATPLLCGETPLHHELDAEIADFLGTEAAIVFAGGHATNVATVGHMFGPEDLILHDEWIHDSSVRGAILSGARRRPFPHNDWAALDRILHAMRGQFRRAIVVIEGAYSQDGDIPDLPRFIEVKKRHEAWLMVDEAHSIGVLGPTGRGIGEHWGVDRSDVDLWMGTISKAIGSLGGYIAASHQIIQFLKFTCPLFIFSTGISPANTAAALEAFRVIRDEPQRVARVQELSEFFRREARQRGMDIGVSRASAVIPVIVGGWDRAMWIANRMLDHGVNVMPIGYPAVARDQCRLRFFINVDHREADLVRSLDLLGHAMTAESQRNDPQAAPAASASPSASPSGSPSTAGPASAGGASGTSASTSARLQPAPGPISGAADVLVTGASGFIGGHLTRRLAEHGHRVRVLVRSDSDRSAFEDLDVEVEVGSLDNTDSLRRATAGVTRVYNCAGMSADWGPWQSFRQTNIEGARNLVEAAHAAGTVERFLHVSTTDVYGYPVRPCDESTPIRDIGLPYNRSKVLGETLVRETAERTGVPLTVIRPVSVYGPRSKDFVIELAGLLLQKQMVYIRRGDVPAGLLYVDNAVDGMIAAATSDRTVGNAYNLRDAEMTTWRQYMEALAAGLGVGAPSFSLPAPVATGVATVSEKVYGALRIKSRPVLTRHAVHLFERDQSYPIDRARADFGFKSAVTFEEGMRRTLAWLDSADGKRATGR